MEYEFGNCNHHNICLYHELSIKIGFEECVEIRRKVKEFEERNKNRLSLSRSHLETICTGSVAEGFRHGKTDRDYMKVLKDIVVLNAETKPNYNSNESNRLITLSIKKNYACWNDGYVLLKFIKDGENVYKDHKQCVTYSKLNNYISSYRFKEWLVKHYAMLDVDLFIHGPCVSMSGLSSDQDFAFSLECKFWPSQAKEWLNRTRLWPSQKLVDEIAKSGCHLVPLGPIKDVKDDLLWRLSFNNAEKKLVFAFNQTQFLCYGLLKIVLKECIEKMESYPENTLCSYFIKTLLFWMIQDTAAELWQPQNIVICFVVCLVRLTMWVIRETCPNFFIPSRNMFKLKVHGHARKHLLNTLKEVHKMGVWKCFAMCSKRFHIATHYLDSSMPFLKPYFVDQSYLRECRWLSSSFLVDDWMEIHRIDETINDELSSELENQFFICQKLSMYQRKAILPVSNSDQINYLTEAKDLDLTRGPLMIASCLYRRSEYNKVIEIINGIKAKLGKFTFYAGINNSDVTNLNEVLNEYALSVECKQYSLCEKRERLLAMDILIRKVTDCFTKAFNERIAPVELWFDLSFQRTMLIIHPLVYLYFLEFLCCKCLLRGDKASMALQELNQVVCNVCKHDDKAMSHLILGISYEVNRDFEDALRHYNTSLSLRNTFTSAWCRGFFLERYLQLCHQDEEYGVD